MSGCKYCGAKPKERNFVHYRGQKMCLDCLVEYYAIFDGVASKKMQRRQEYEKKEKGQEATEENRLPFGESI